MICGGRVFLEVVWCAIFCCIFISFQFFFMIETWLFPFFCTFWLVFFQKERSDTTCRVGKKIKWTKNREKLYRHCDLNSRNVAGQNSTFWISLTHICACWECCLQLFVYNLEGLDHSKDNNKNRFLKVFLLSTKSVLFL